ncbi:MAG: LysE family transporter [Candidatus Nanopelagicales bacterium]|nr:LysE family transporter [Actinomycetota bacterium]
MSDLATLFVRMLIIGIAVAAPVGAMGVLLIQRTLTSGWRSGAATGLGIATADATYAAVAAFGITAISDLLVDYQTPLRLIGGVALLWLGWRAFRAPAPTAPSVAQVSHARNFSSAVGLTLTNPLTIMAFAAIFAGAGLVTQPGASAAVVSIAGVALGSLLWWTALILAVSLVRHALSPRAMHAVNRASGVVLAVFGVIAIIAGGMSLIGG